MRGPILIIIRVIDAHFTVRRKISKDVHKLAYGHELRHGSSPGVQIIVSPVFVPTAPQAVQVSVSFQDT